MKLPVFCLTCTVQGIADKQTVKVVELRDDGRYDTICSNGHSYVIVLQQLKFEVLFDIGAYAIADGYYREAVSSFTSSLERFYEFVIRVILYDKGLSNESIGRVWSDIGKHSERQLGAFVVLYSSEFQVPPPIPSSKQVEFRNDVIHRGKIPNRAEAVRYGEQILSLVRPVLRQLKEKYPTSIQKVVDNHVTECRNSGGDPDQPISTMYVETIVSVAVTDPKHDERSLEEAISNLKTWPAWVRGGQTLLTACIAYPADNSALLGNEHHFP